MQIKLRKIAIFLLLILMSLAVVGCDNSTSTTVETTIQTNSEQTTTEATTQTTTLITSSTTLNDEYPRIEVTDNQKVEYNLNSSFDSTKITVSLVKASGPSIQLSSSIYTITGFDSSTAGENTITVSYLDYTTTFTVTIVDPGDIVNITLSYYLSAQSLSGSALFDELHTIINTGFQGVTYGQARYILDESDVDPSNENNLILIYLGTSINNDWDSGATWNREHVWPQSLLPDSASNETVNTASDLQNLKPADPGENSSRSNRYYANQTVAGLSYCPRDEVKGDVARILLYMITMYEELSLVDTSPGLLQMGLFSVLLEWHELDPVDDFERNRNDVIYSYQHNRNPYIDYPEFVDLIWGE